MKQTSSLASVSDSPAAGRARRVAVIAQQAPTVVNFRGALLKEMVARGIEVLAFAPDYDDATRAAVKAFGAVPMDYSMSATGTNPMRDILDLFRLAAQLRNLNLAASFAFTTKPAIYATLAARMARVPRRFAMIEGAGYVFTDDDNLGPRRHLLRALVTRLLRIGLSQAHGLFLLNPDDRELFVGGRMVDAAKVQMLEAIGVDLDHFHPAAPVCGPITFISVARLLKEKGVYEYIEAARRVKAVHPETRFLLLGDAHPNPGSLSTSEVQSLVSEGVIEWPGHVADVRPWMAQSSVFVLPSYREGMPRSTQEAMAMGRPVITTDVPGCRQTVAEGINGFLVPVRDSEALAGAMQKFIEQPELVVRMGAASRSMAKNRFDVNQINDRILATMNLLPEAQEESQEPVRLTVNE